MMKFDLPKEQSSIIKVIGVGGGGSNAVNHMFNQEIKGVDFIICNTDQQALDISPVPVKVVLGTSLTEGRGAGSMPEVGRNAAIENLDEIKEILSRNTKMLFVTAGMGGGTGTGAAPVIAEAARAMGILTVGIVTIPFSFEGKKRKMQAEQGLEELKKHVDTLLVISNDKLREIYGNLKLTEAFGHADDVLSNAAKSIAEIINVTLHINVDFEDIKTVMKDSGVAIMGSASAEGENRAIKAVEAALNSPLLNDNDIRGARYVLLNITAGNDEITMDELGEITDYIQEAAGQTADLIKGYGIDETLGNRVKVTIIATGFDRKENPVDYSFSKPQKVIKQLEEEKVQPQAVIPAVEEEKPLNTDIPQEVVKNFEIVPEVNNTHEEPVQPAAEIEEGMKEFSKEEEFQEPFIISKSTSENQVSFEFDVKQNDLNNIQSKRQDIQPDPVLKRENKEPNKIISNEEQMKRAKERMERLKELSMKLKTPQGINDMEREPAYKRRNVELDVTPHSSESQVSKYTLSEGDDKAPEIRPNNSFLHDNVD